MLVILSASYGGLVAVCYDRLLRLVVVVGGELLRESTAELLIIIVALLATKVSDWVAVESLYCYHAREY
jgi:hypothetical protein